jgi:hypothetical protein
VSTDTISVSYSFAPAWDDGYVVRVDGLGDARPLVYAYVEKLKWSEGTGHQAVPYPRVVVSELDVNLLEAVLAAVRIPATSRCEWAVLDGACCKLTIASGGYLVAVDWGAGQLPHDARELLKVTEVLEKYAKKSLEA